jgi:hypothetical protein
VSLAGAIAEALINGGLREDAILAGPTWRAVGDTAAAVGKPSWRRAFVVGAGIGRLAALTVHANLLADAPIATAGVAVDSGAQHRVFANASSTNPRKSSKVTCGAVHHVGVATLTVHWIARVLGALISVVANDVGAQHRVFANASGTNARQTPEVAGHPGGDVRVVTLPVERIAGVVGALVAIIANDVGAQYRIFANAGGTNARQTPEVTRRSIGNRRMRTLPVCRIAGVGGALVLIIAVDVRAQHTATGSTTACGTTGTGYPTGARNSAGA